MAVGDVNNKEKIRNADFIGITGFAQVGKDETVKILNELGFERVSLADKVRQGIYNINPIVFIPEHLAYQFKLTDGMGGSDIINFPDGDNLIQFGILQRLRFIVDRIGWDDAKKIPEIRRLLQYYGTEGAREIFGDTIWTDTADKYIQNKGIKKVAISDVRFLNELDWVKTKPNHLIIKITRPNVSSINSHSSDAGIADELCDLIIDNNGSIEDLRSKLI